MLKNTAEEMTDESVPVEDKWMIDMHQFLSSGLPPEVMNRDEHKQLTVKSKHFYLV